MDVNAEVLKLEEHRNCPGNYRLKPFRKYSFLEWEGENSGGWKKNEEAVENSKLH